MCVAVSLDHVVLSGTVLSMSSPRGRGSSNIERGLPDGVDVEPATQGSYMRLAAGSGLGSLP